MPVKAKKMALTAFMASVNDGSAKARTPRSNGSGAGGASAGRSAMAMAMSAVKMAARIDTTAPQPSQVSLPNVRSDAGTKTMAAEMATQPAVHIACSETALKAVEMVRRAEPATKVQTARRRARERKSARRSSRRRRSWREDAHSQYATPNSSPHHLPNMRVPQSEIESAERAERVSCVRSRSRKDEKGSERRRTHLRVLQLERPDIHVTPHRCRCDPRKDEQARDEAEREEGAGEAEDADADLALDDEDGRRLPADAVSGGGDATKRGRESGMRFGREGE